MSTQTAIDLIEKYFSESFDSAWERIGKEIEAARQSIKHPHFQYAYHCNGKTTYKIKPPWQWFSGKRIVKTPISKMKSIRLGGYKKPDNK